MGEIDHLEIDPHKRLDLLNTRIILLKEETTRLMKERKNINLAADWQGEEDGINVEDCEVKK